MAELTHEELEYPAESWTGFFREHFGPSMLWALISIGGSHIILAPTLGGFFGIFAVWIFLLIYVAKYGGWELGIRYTYGVGGNPVEAYGDLPGPKNWAMWVSVFIFTVLYTGITAAVGFGTAALAAALTPLDPLSAYGILLAIAVGVVVFSRYGLLENILKVFTAILGVLIVLGVLFGPPSTGVIAETATSLPEGTSLALFVGLFAAAAGFAPTGHSTSILIGSWSMAKKEGAQALREEGVDPNDERYHDYIAAWIKTGRRDFNIGYAFSLVIMLSMVLLAANVLYPNPPTDENLAFVLGDILSDSFGPWSFWAMLVCAFAALYSTVITLLDGGSRATADILPLALENDDLDSERIRRFVVVGMGVGSLIPIVVIGELPVTLILWISVLLVIFEVFFYPANWYIVERRLPEAFRPSTRWKIYYVVTIVLVVIFALMGAAEELGILGV